MTITTSTATSSKRVLVAGATGHFGGMIARALLDRPGVYVRCLVRDPGGDKAAHLAAAGAELVPGDLAPGGEASLRAACEGVDAIVSAVQGGPDVIIEGQMRLLRAAAAAGVRRFVPSDYSFDFFNLAPGANINSDWRRSFAEQAAGNDVEVVHLMCGCFLDRRVLFGFLGAFDLAAREAYLWGDGNAAMNFTTFADTARYAAEVAVDPEPLPGRFHVAGDTLSFHALLDAYTTASGKRLTVVRKGSLQDLDAEIARRRSSAPGNFLGYLPLMYWRAMLDGTGKLGALQNARYPGIRPTTVREYVAREGL